MRACCPEPRSGFRQSAAGANPSHFAAIQLMRITEIFFSIQGESTHAGKPCVFVRLTGCSLRFVYCDTKYSYAGGRDMSLEEVLAVVAAHPEKLVNVIGGAT